MEVNGATQLIRLSRSLSPVKLDSTWNFLGSFSPPQADSLMVVIQLELIDFGVKFHLFKSWSGQDFNLHVFRLRQQTGRHGENVQTNAK